MSNLVELPLVSPCDVLESTVRKQEGLPDISLWQNPSARFYSLSRAQSAPHVGRDAISIQPGTHSLRFVLYASLMVLGFKNSICPCGQMGTRILAQWVCAERLTCPVDCANMDCIQKVEETMKCVNLCED